MASQMNASSELIPGMDKLLEYMKNQDKKIKELQEQIKELKEKQQYQPKGSRIDPEGLHDYMKEEIDELKQEITEEMIIREYGDESLQAKKYGFGMYNPDYVKALDKSSSSDASMSESEDE